MTDDLGNQRAVDKRNKRLKTGEGQMKEALRFLMGDGRGRVYLGHLVAESQALLSINAPPPDGGQFFLGKRSMGIKLLEDVAALDEPGKPRNLTALIASALPKAPEAKTPEGENDGTDPDPE